MLLKIFIGIVVFVIYIFILYVCTLMDDYDDSKFFHL